MNPRRMAGVALLMIAGATVAATNSTQRVRAFAQLPDWTGLWETEFSKASVSPSGYGSLEGPADIARHVRLLTTPPYKAEWVRRQHNSANSPPAPSSIKNCDWSAFPLTMEAPTMFQVVVTPEETLMVFDKGAVRHIYTDGRSHPPKEELWPTRMGDSIGHWDKETLVIDTVARSSGPVFVGPAASLGEQAHFVERIRRVDRSTLEDQMTIEDPERLARPWELTIHYSRVIGLNRMITWDCEFDRVPSADAPTDPAAGVSKPIRPGP